MRIGDQSHENTQPVSPEHFLSRLFGGEEWWVFAQTIELFLSRLFGGEASREH